MVQLFVKRQFDDASGYMTDIGLVVSVPSHYLFSITAAKYAHRHAACRVDNFPREINGQVGDRDATFLFRFPLFGSGEIQVKGKFLAGLDDGR